MKKCILLFVLSTNFLFAQQITPFIQERQIVHESVVHSNQNNILKSIPIWGAGAATGGDDGEFNGGLLGWSTISINDLNGVPGDALWTYSSTGISQGAYWGSQNPIASPTLDNGVAIFDSDFMDNGGVAGAFGTGSSPGPHKGELISPIIDLSGYTNEALSVDFYCQWRSYVVNEFSVSLSTDNGTTWSTVDINILLPSPQNAANEGWVSAVFSDITVGVNDLTQCRIKFSFDGNYYYAMVDDVSINIAAIHDLTIALESPNGNTLADKFKEVQVTNNRHFIESQINTHHLIFGANVKNFGVQNVLPTDGAQLNVQIQINEAGEWISVHDQNVDIDTVYTNEGRIVIDTLNSTSWLQEGDFRTRYTTQLSSDLNATNDTVFHYFSINSSYMSKVDIDTLGRPAHTRPIFPGGTEFSSFEYGSMFELSNTENEDLNVDSISFKYYVPSTFNGPESQSVVVWVYRFEDGLGPNDGILDESELTAVGVGIAELNGIGTTISNGTYGSGATEILNPVSGSVMDELSDGYYLISLALNPSLTGGSATFNADNSIWLGASEQKNYSMNAALTQDGDIVAHPSPLRILDATGSGDWNWIGFGADIVPSIGVHFPCEATSGYDIQSVCNNYTWIDGNTYTSDTTVSFSIEQGSANGCDSIVTLELTIIPGVTGVIDVQSACNSYTWIDGNTYTTDTTVTFSIEEGAANGCDSIVTLELTMIPVNTSTININELIQANAVDASYQWIDCNNGNLAIDGETQQIFGATSNGDYAVIVTQNNCSDTSDCVNVSSLGINELMGTLEVFPNPTNGKVTILIDNLEDVNISLISSTGVTLFSRDKVNESKINISLKNYSQGVYFIEVQGAEERRVVKLIKQ
tara:strand:- start:274 stop:2874 length:2601 start_codon:yes stop_codon:yes gene_type:complete